MTDRPEFNSTALRRSTERTILPVVAASAAFMGLLSLGLEVGTGQWFMHALESPVFLSTPLGVGSAFITGLALRNDVKRAAVPAVMVLLYWIGFFVFL